MPRTLSTTLPGYCLALLLAGTGTFANEPSAPAPDAAAATAPSSTPRPALAERSQAEALALQQRLPSGEQQQLQAASDTFLALWKPANKGEAQGIVILVPGAGETADWPQAVGPLRSKLPDAGWHTLSITLPDPQASASPVNAAEPTAPAPADSAPADAPATEAAAVANPPASEASSPESTASTETPEHYAERVLARIQAAIEFARQQKPRSIVVLGHGTGGYWAARYLSEHKLPDVQNVLLVAAQLPAQLTPTLDELVPKLQLAIGDFYYADQPLARSAAQLRQQASKRQKSPAYIQVAMAALPGDPSTEQEQLYRRIRGWLSLHIRAQASGPGA